MKVIFLFLSLCVFSSLTIPDDDEAKEYAVEMDMDSLEADLDFSPFNLEVVRHVSPLGNVYHLRHTSSCSDNVCKRSISDKVAEFLRNHPLIRRVEEQVDLEVEQKSEYYFSDKDLGEEIQKKSFDEFDDAASLGFDTLVDVEKKQTDFEDDYWIHGMDTLNDDGYRKSLDSDIPEMGYDLTEDDKQYLRLVEERREILRNIHFNDPEAEHLWQYNNYGQFNRINPGMDMNIYQVYLANITGKGVVVTVIDDGLDTHHIDIAKNYDPAASLDFNDPHNTEASPRGTHENRKMPLIEGHGTECASVIGGVANNNFCAHGVAFNVNLGGIRMLARNMVTDLLEAYALTHNNQYIDIYSNSWGPKDSGQKTSSVTFYVNKAFEAGVTKGRGGKGSIFLFAAGNGGLKYDHCGADGLVNSPYSIAVTAINIHGRKPAYTEECSAISITAAVGGYGYDQMYERDDPDPVLIASQVNGKCVKRFLGTSAATPLIAGCIALAFEANPDLSWRDIQHLMTISARIPNSKETVWQLNTAGFLISHYYGFGLLDCSGFVNNAMKWKNVGESRTCIGGKTKQHDDLVIRRKKRTRLTFQTTACESTDKSIEYLEHVRIHTKIQHPCRGDLSIILSSPTGTRSFLLKNRKWDRNNKTLTFSFLSLMNWGENPRGIWNLDVIDIGKCRSQSRSGDRTGKIITATLEFYGTQRRDSAIYRNEKLINKYFKDIKLERPRKTVILNERDLYDIFNEQRKYFIQIKPSKTEYTEQDSNEKNNQIR